jgi:CBS domain-containing membrane protein
MDKNTPITSVMTKKVIVAELNSKFTDIQKLFLEYQIYHLPVVFDNKLLGIISIKDALKTYAERASALESGDAADINNKFSIESIMTHDPKTISSDSTLGKAVEILASASFRSLPVVDSEGKIVGILSNKDLVKLFNKNLNSDDEDKRYVSGTPGRAV